MVNPNKREIDDDLYGAAKDFLIGEFNAPEDSVGEDSYSMYEYRGLLVRIATDIMGVYPEPEKKSTKGEVGDDVLDITEEDD